MGEFARKRAAVPAAADPRYCVLPIPRTACFSLAWTDLPTHVTDANADEVQLVDRKRV
ncbi:MAG TPA: hypothetical protein GXZ30_01245 [Propionibacterium sp.]|nr:hypothetical protein [Propionibacterium sp.]